MQRDRVVYALLAVGAIGMFLGHGMLAISGEKSFLQLITGSFDNVLGTTVPTGIASAWLAGIGWLDTAIGAVILLMLLGNLRGTGRLYEFAYSRFALVIYTWSAFWGFVTAVARVTAVGELMPELWDVVERAPNFMLPATLAYLVYQHRVHYTRFRESSGSRG